jgi:hypothetical protein
MRRISLLICLVVLSCTGGTALAQSCRLPQKPMVEAQLMFGRNIGGKLGVTESRWTKFLNDEIVSRFPNGLTVIDAAGQWREPAHKRLIREPSKMVMILSAEDRLQEKIDGIVEAYKRRFRQDSVGVVIRPACVSF